MTPQQFLKQELTVLAAKFPHIQIRYGFDTMIDTHIVQLDPVQEYYHNEELDATWIPIAMAFDEQFEDAISFISSDSTLRLESVEMEWNTAVSNFIELAFYNEMVSVIETRQVSFDFPTADFYKRRDDSFVFFSIENLTVTSSDKIKSGFLNTINQKNTLVIKRKEEELVQAAGNTSYAMAA